MDVSELLFWLSSTAIINPQKGGYSFFELANLAVAVAILFAGGLSVFYIFVGGISFILSGGQEEKIKQAVHTIRYAIIGLIVTFIAITIITVVGSVLDFNLVSYLSWEKINELIDKILNSLSNQGSGGSGTLR
jgi:Flp pilus assembly pilin Flp